MKRKKEEILEDITAGLTRMVEILDKDDQCTWVKGFRSLLSMAIELREKGCPEELFREFCGSVRHIFSGGMGSFNDYFPQNTDPKTGQSADIPGTEDFEELGNKLYELADEFRIIGSY